MMKMARETHAARDRLAEGGIVVETQGVQAKPVQARGRLAGLLLGRLEGSGCLIKRL